MLKYIKNLGLSALLCCVGIDSAEPYDSIRLLSAEPYFLENGFILLDKVNNTNTSVFIDIESPKGEAARFIAATTNSDVRVYSVCAWDSAEHLYHKFLSNVRHENLDERIVPVRMSSEEASNALEVLADVIYIDSTDADSVEGKILSWITHLSDEGVIAGNQWQWTSVELAVVSAAAKLNLVLTINGNYWFLRR